MREVPLRLLCGGGVYDESTDALFIADLHLGKGTTFRKHSIAVPSGASQATLDRVATLIDRVSPQRLFILGDLFHVTRDVTEQVRSGVEQFLLRYGQLQVVLVRGNHDRGIERIASTLPLSVVPEDHAVGALCLRHHPPASRNAVGQDTRVEIASQNDPANAGESGRANGVTSLTLAGHVHPAFHLRRANEDFGRQPCFWYSQNCLVLPAIGRFTGAFTVTPAAGDRVWVDAGGTVMEIPLAAC